jgi:hypothetical protein
VGVVMMMAMKVVVMMMMMMMMMMMTIIMQKLTRERLGRHLFLLLAEGAPKSPLLLVLHQDPVARNHGVNEVETQRATALSPHVPRPELLHLGGGKKGIIMMSTTTMMMMMRRMRW